MIKALVKKQFLEFFHAYFQSRKTGKKRSGIGVAAFFVLFAVLLLTLAGVFFGVSYMLCAPLVIAGYSELYFTVMILISIMLGVFGSVFNTYASLYQAKDNDFLLSMPIPPATVLVSRLIAVFLMGFMYESIVIIPSFVAYFLVIPPTVLSVIASVLILLLVGIFILVVTCVLGFLVAAITAKMKNKSIITVISSLVFIVAYYFVYSKAADFINGIVQNAEKTDTFVNTWFYPIYQAGKALSGDWISLGIFALVCIALLFVTFFVMSKSFIKISTQSSGAKKSKYDIKSVKESSTSTALIRKEFMRFKQNATYMLNCGLGIIIMPAAGIVMLVNKSRIGDFIAVAKAETPFVSSWLFVAISIMCLMLTAFDSFTAPSISLEGKSLWILKSLPVSPRDVLMAKINTHLILNFPSMLIFSVCAAITLSLDFSETIILLAFSFIAVEFVGSFGLFLNLKMPNLTWTNEIVPIKQSMPVTISIFGTWGISVAFGVLYYFVSEYFEPYQYVCAMLIIIALATRFINRWIYGSGTKIFTNL